MLNHIMKTVRLLVALLGTVVLSEQLLVSYATAITSQWTSVGLSGQRIKFLAIDATDSRIIYAGVGVFGGIFKTTNSGASWTAFNTGLPSYSSIDCLAIDPMNSQTIYVGVGGSGGVFKTTNGGASWTAVNTGLVTTLGIYQQ
jgi:photosystem II stability/assembly factor-like uncharacterized protein